MRTTAPGRVDIAQHSQMLHTPIINTTVQAGEYEYSQPVQLEYKTKAAEGAIFAIRSTFVT